MNEQNMKVHQIKIDFNVTEDIKRFVYVYIIEAQHCYLIDSGVYGCEQQIIEYLKKIGRDSSDIKGIFLTHAHPDHIGSAAWFQENTGCRIYASEGEKRWIEDIDLQFKERPIPNFYNLAGKSSKVDRVVKDNDVISLEKSLDIIVIGTPGHSADEVSYLVGDALFIGDSVPVKGDIPIMIDEQDSRHTLERIAALPDIEVYYPAWDHTYSKEEMADKLASAKELLDMLKAAVLEMDDGMELSHLVDLICERLKMPMLKMNPLFAITIQSLRKDQS
ncbi:MAG: MBL fold metallo-hydrolase [Eubacteriales bacterium]|nr:MBL fold metallo-hydrolase [Eubacteriales bacterium]